MTNKEQWMKDAENISNHYLNLDDGGFDETMKSYFIKCNYEEKSIPYGFPTQKWQVNEKGGLHGGAISGMFDTAFGVVANFIAGKDEATTTDMVISYLRPLDIGNNIEIKVITVKAGRSMIRLRAEMICKETGKLIATGSGSWMPL